MEQDLAYRVGKARHSLLQALFWLGVGVVKCIVTP